MRSLTLYLKTIEPHIKGIGDRLASLEPIWNGLLVARNAEIGRLETDLELQRAETGKLEQKIHGLGDVRKQFARLRTEDDKLMSEYLKTIENLQSKELELTDLNS